MSSDLLSRAVRPVIESLELRKLMAHELIDGEIWVLGTSSDDTLSVVRTSSLIKVTSEGVTSSYPNSSVTAIYVDAGAGNDRIVGSTAILQDIFTIDGGTGDDTVAVFGTTSPDLAVFDGDTITHNDDSLVLSNVELREFDGRGGTGGDTLTVASGPDLLISSTQRLASLTVDDGASASVLPGFHALIETGALDIDSGARFDLADNDMIVHDGDTTIATVTARIASGYNSGAWDGDGIVSSVAANEGNTSLGILTGEDFLNNSGNTEFAGVGVDETDLLVKYTFQGDWNLDGAMADDDLFIFLPYYTDTLSGGWGNGDSTFDGVVDDADLFQFLPNYLAELEQADLARPADVTAVKTGTDIVALNWGEYAGTVDYYSIWIAKDGGEYVPYDIVSSAATSYDFVSDYYGAVRFQVRAHTDDHVSPATDAIDPNTDEPAQPEVVPAIPAGQGLGLYDNFPDMASFPIGNFPEYIDAEWTEGTTFQDLQNETLKLELGNIPSHGNVAAEIKLWNPSNAGTFSVLVDGEETETTNAGGYYYFRIKLDHDAVDLTVEITGDGFGGGQSWWMSLINISIPVLVFTHDPIPQAPPAVLAQAMTIARDMEIGGNIAPWKFEELRDLLESYYSTTTITGDLSATASNDPDVSALERAAIEQLRWTVDPIAIFVGGVGENKITAVLIPANIAAFQPTITALVVGHEDAIKLGPIKSFIGYITSDIFLQKEVVDGDLRVSVTLNVAGGVQETRTKVFTNVDITAVDLW